MKPYKNAILRVPQFPMDATLEESWEKLKESIKQSTPDFYLLIENLSFKQLSKQPEHIQRSISKYFSRAKYRCTPYGRFASVGVVEIVNAATPEIILERERVLHELPNWPDHVDIISGQEYDKLKVFANSTYYKFGTYIRYIKRVNELFELAEISYDPTIERILKELVYPVPYRELIKSFPDAEPYIAPLIDCGLIITEQEPNMIGQDYFARLGFQPANATKYQISEVNSQGLKIPASYFRHIPDLIKILKTSISGSTTSPQMQSFIERFAKRFDRKTVPLMEAIDPDIGVGYGDFYSHVISTLIKELQLEETSILINPVGQYLLKVLEKSEVGDIIRLDELKELPSKIDGPVLANSVALFCSINEGIVYFERIGGHSFNQLAGRFTIASDNIRSLCQNVAQFEEEANPNVLFFDISYNAEINVDNVNRRAQLYSQELNILNFPGIDEPITLDDLYITVSGSEVMLRSKKLGKRLIPRMASAYNYRRSKLPVFRFLYDLSFQGLIGDLSFSFTDLIKDRIYYPQVQFRNIILSLPKVRVSKTDIISGRGHNPVTLLMAHLAVYKIGPIVKIPRNEESIVFDLNCPSQSALLVQEIIKSGWVLLESVESPNVPLIKDSDGRAFNNQLSIPLTHCEELYKESSPIDQEFKENRLFMPLQNWLYLQIYCSPSQSDEIIIVLNQLISNWNHLIEKWFFIRYNENGDHIRIRALFNHSCHVQFLDQIYKSLESKINFGMISNISINTYDREIERYGVAGIENVETHFTLDSNLVVRILEKGDNDLSKYCHCIRLFNLVKNHEVIGAYRWAQWTGHIRQMFEREHGLGVEQFRKIRNYFQEHKEQLLTSLDMIDPNEIELSLSIKEIIKKCSQRRQAPMLTDLMHMHINRLFSDYQRSHELVIFSLLDLVEKNLQHNVKNYNHRNSMHQ